MLEARGTDMLEARRAGRREQHTKSCWSEHCGCSAVLETIWGNKTSKEKISRTYAGLRIYIHFYVAMGWNLLVKATKPKLLVLSRTIWVPQLNTSFTRTTRYCLNTNIGNSKGQFQHQIQLQHCYLNKHLHLCNILLHSLLCRNPWKPRCLPPATCPRST